MQLRFEWKDSNIFCSFIDIFTDRWPCERFFSDGNKTSKKQSIINE